MNGDSDSGRNVFFSFLKLYEGFKFEERICAGEEFESRIFIVKIAFVDEKNEGKIDGLKGMLDDKIEKLMYKFKPFNEESLAKKRDKIDDFVKEASRIVDENGIVFVDTQEIIKEEIKDLLMNGIRLEN